MSTPITLSGFNNIDFGMILNLVMQQASQPLQVLQSRQSSLATEGSAYALLATRLGTLETAAADLSTSTGVTSYAASVSDPTAVAVGPTSSAVGGTYNVVVTSLAAAQVTASTSTAPDADTTAVATGGTLTIGGVAVTVTGSLTLQGLAAQINATTNVPATASVVESAPGAYRLVLTGTKTGTANAFTVTNALTGGAGVTFGGNTLTAADASLSINGLAITSASNTLTSAIPGVTLSLMHADPLKTVAVSVSPDDAALVAKVQTFVSAYNSLNTFVQAQSAAAASGQTGTLAHDTILRQARSALRASLGAGYGSATFTHLAEVGIGFDQAGSLTLDKTALTSALTQSRSSVVSLFVGTGTTGGFTNGAFGTLQGAMHEFTQAGGFVSTAQARLETQSRRLDTLILDMQDRLALQRAALQKEYTAADQAMTRLKAQSASLSSLPTGLF
jgi:flagellar hook-associated protein 2